MNSILNLDDFLKPETQFKLLNKTFTLNTSMKAFIAFTEWNSKVQNKSPDDINIHSQNELLKIIVKEADDFIETFNTLNVKNQVVILTKLVEYWNKEINAITENNDSAKK